MGDLNREGQVRNIRRAGGLGFVRWISSRITATMVPLRRADLTVFTERVEESDQDTRMESD